MDFYGDVLRNLILALGGALFVGNVLALVHRERDGEHRRDESETDLAQAPVVRSVLYAGIGLVMVLWWVGTMFAS